MALKGHGFSGSGKTLSEALVLKGHGFRRCGRTLRVALVLKGHDFSRAVAAAKCLRL
jgi:hypothetical protein